ncbi:hypothetical protein HLRTI_002565 [Halorhabdus tiamatea SARL4B]|uniref:ATP phosphoribosyltransferase n=2 Tax=Halorhabdus tiamatea SARL4B TaxID=1033806 RepID=U2F540_9EURY|nr:hypothetical protein [Halorhabdus tiamatea]ERJ05410.1 hypothetical protein HLRTI_002565 [Halorhabdus tiamatea SARL4B]
MTSVRMAVPRKGRPLEAVLERIASRTGRTGLADGIISTLRYEKAIAKGDQKPDAPVYDRLSSYSDAGDPTAPEYTLMRDDRQGMPRRIVFDSVTIPTESVDLELVGREEPFRALRKHEFALGFDSADLVLEEVVGLEPEPLTDLAALNARIDPLDTDVRVHTGLGDTVYHTLLATPSVADTLEGDLTREFVADYAGELAISPRYERLVTAVLGTGAVEGIDFRHPDRDRTEEDLIAEVGLGVYITVSGSTARDHGLLVGDRLFPSETVLLENEAEMTGDAELAVDLVDGADIDTALAIQ